MPDKHNIDNAYFGLALERQRRTATSTWRHKAYRICVSKKRNLNALKSSMLVMMLDQFSVICISGKTSQGTKLWHLPEHMLAELVLCAGSVYTYKGEKERGR